MKKKLNIEKRLEEVIEERTNAMRLIIKGTKEEDMGCVFRGISRMDKLDKEFSSLIEELES